MIPHNKLMLPDFFSTPPPSQSLVHLLLGHFYYVYVFFFSASFFLLCKLLWCGLLKGVKYLVYCWVVVVKDNSK